MPDGFFLAGGSNERLGSRRLGGSSSSDADCWRTISDATAVLLRGLNLRS